MVESRGLKKTMLIKPKSHASVLFAIIIIKTYDGCHDLIEKATIFDNVAVPFVKEMIKYVKISHKYNEKIRLKKKS